MNLTNSCCHDVCCGNYSLNCVTNYYNYQFMFLASSSRYKRLKGSGRCVRPSPKLLVHTEYVSHIVKSCNIVFV
jgi:hypothetical protein